MPTPTRIEIAPSGHVTAIAYPALSRDRLGVRLILAHGAGASQTSGFMVQFATALAGRGIDTLTFNFLYSENGKRIPDRTDKLEACYRRVIQAVDVGAFEKSLGRGALVVGGKSMGGRIASQIAAGALHHVAGLVFLGYPLHPPGQPEKLRVKHLSAIQAPMLFVQGARDAFGTPDELGPILRGLKAPADLCIVEDGDHSFKVPKRAGPSQEQVYEFVLDQIGCWLRGKILRQRPSAP
jgi:predicted alpha/beta-hydrolase family hydrolase